MEPCTKVDFIKDDDVTAIIQTIRQESNVFTLTSEQLAKKFLNKSLCDCFSSKSFDEMRSAYIEATHKEDVPANADGFYDYILQRYFRYWQEPKIVLAEYYERAIKDWNEVEDRIKTLKEEIITLKRLNNPTTNQKRLPIVYFYLKHTEIALEDITTFLKKEIHKFVLRKCEFPKNAITWDVYPYHYYFSAPAYDIKESTMISNKFTLADSDKRKEFIDAYENRRQEFDEFLRKYIEDHDVLSAIRYNCEINYFLNKRKEFIKEALEVYERGNYILFSSACFLIVEGILHDICLSLVKDKSSVLGCAFQKKLDVIHEVSKVDIDYQYYSFMFRLLRNEVAHGTASPGMLRENANLLLLDLLDTIEVTKSNRILLNPKRYFLASALQNTKDRFNYIAGYFILIDVEIPAFYDSQASHNELLAILNENNFWSYIDKLCKSEFGYERATGIEVLKKIGSLKIKALENEYLPRLRGYKDIKDEFDLEDYLKYMLQYNYW